MGHAKTVLGNFALSGQVNREGYPSFKRDWKEQYLQMLLTNSMKDAFYASGQELCKDALELHRFAADEDPVFMARALAFARNEGFMRLQPIVGLAVLSLCSPTQFSQAFPQVIRIVPDLAEFSLALESLGRGQGGRAVKRSVSLFLNSLDEYAAMKYAGKGRGFTLRDLVRVYHPKPKDDKSADLFRYINKKLVWDDGAKARLPQLDAYEQLKRIDHNDTAKAVELISAGRLPDNVVTGIVNSSNADIWQALLPDMPMFSLLRHLVSLVRHGVLTKEFNEFVASRLSDAEAIKRAKILPFRFVQAWRQLDALRRNKTVESPEGNTLDKEWWLLKVLEKAVEASVEAMPDLPGRTAVMLDISGSMQGRFLDAGSVLALSLLKKTGGRGRFMLFDTESDDVHVDPNETIIRAASRIDTRGGTDTGVCLKQLTREKDFFDTLIIVTDEQQNTGSPFYKQLRKYRREINPEARAFVIDVSPYGSAMTPPDDGKTWYCYGWSDQIVSFIALALRGYGDLVETVSKINLAAGEGGAASA